LVLVGLRADLRGVLRLGRPALHQPDREEDVEEELQVLRLPVLHDVHGERRGRQVLEERHRLGADRDLLVVVLRQPGDRLPDEREQEQAAEHQAEAVVAQGAAHRVHRPRNPISVKYAKPTPITTR
jgi:hypothetical protein